MLLLDRVIYVKKNVIVKETAYLLKFGKYYFKNEGKED